MQAEADRLARQKKLRELAKAAPLEDEFLRAGKQVFQNHKIEKLPVDE